MDVLGDDIEVNSWREDWALALMEKGLIVNLHISKWNSKTRLEYEDLGIIFNNEENRDFFNKYISLGHEKLFPPSVISEISSTEKRARDCLKNHSFDTVWGKFVPFSSFREWKRENELLKTEFFDLARGIGLKYNDIIKEVKLEYEKKARDVWRRTHPEDKNEPPKSFLENFTSKVISKIPSREHIVSSFKYSYTFFQIPLPSLIQEDIAKAEKILIDREKAANNLVLEMETKRIIAEEYREKKKDLIDSFLSSTVDSLRHHIAELADHIYRALQKTESHVSMRYVTKIKTMINMIKNFNFHNDEEMDKILNQLLIEVDKYKGERDKAKITQKLSELTEMAKKEYIPNEYNPIIDIIDID
jgi:hypothetical protein